MKRILFVAFATLLMMCASALERVPRTNLKGSEQDAGH